MWGSYCTTGNVAPGGEVTHWRSGGGRRANQEAEKQDKGGKNGGLIEHFNVVNRDI